MAALYADENVPRPLIEALIGMGHDVLTALVDGRANQNIIDSKVLERDHSLGRAVLSNNWWDFARLHRQAAVHSGVVVYTEDPNYVGLAARISAAITALPSLANELIRVYRESSPPPP